MDIKGPTKGFSRYNKVDSWIHMVREFQSWFSLVLYFLLTKCYFWFLG
jgi:hypothetical protein